MPKKSGFTLIELLIVIVILGILAVVGLASFTSSQMKSRDAKRKADLRQVAEAFEIYFNDKGQYPAHDPGGTGRIMGCGNYTTGPTACTWGSLTVPFSNTGVTPNTVYMIKLPADPSSYKYFYVSTGTTYKLYAHLENTQDKNLISTGLNCGTGAVVSTSDSCNYGVSSSNTVP